MRSILSRESRGFHRIAYRSHPDILVSGTRHRRTCRTVSLHVLSDNKCTPPPSIYLTEPSAREPFRGAGERIGRSEFDSVTAEIRDVFVVHARSREGYGQIVVVQIAARSRSVVVGADQRSRGIDKASLDGSHAGHRLEKCVGGGRRIAVVVGRFDLFGESAAVGG